MNLNEAKELEDAAKRINESVALHLMAHKNILEVTGRWCAFKLSDGRTDNETYSSKDEAIAHQEPYEREYCYLKIPPDGISVKHAIGFLRANRHPFVDVLSPEHKINPLIYKPSATMLNTEYSE